MQANDVGPTVQWARKRAGMTQQKLAEAVGMPQPSIARIERGTVMPRAATLIALLEATGHELVVVPRADSPSERQPAPAANDIGLTTGESR
jgi:transcriptional regulator with XRE-family HTH domain